MQCCKTFSATKTNKMIPCSLCVLCVTCQNWLSFLGEGSLYLKPMTQEEHHMRPTACGQRLTADGEYRFRSSHERLWLSHVRWQNIECESGNLILHLSRCYFFLTRSIYTHNKVFCLAMSLISIGCLKIYWDVVISLLRQIDSVSFCVSAETRSQEKKWTIGSIYLFFILRINGNQGVCSA